MLFQYPVIEENRGVEQRGAYKSSKEKNCRTLKPNDLHSRKWKDLPCSQLANIKYNKLDSIKKSTGSML